MNEIIEKIIQENLIKTDENEFGYMIKGEAILEINRLGYDLIMNKEGITYRKREDSRRPFSDDYECKIKE